MSVRILNCDVMEGLRQLPDESVHCVVTSPPYWGLRSYLKDDHPLKAFEIGSEPTLQEHIAKLVEVFREVRRVLRKDGTLWLNYGDAYCNTDKWGGGGANTGKHVVAADGGVASWAVRKKRATPDGLKPKDLMGLPWRLAFALQEDGWWLRSDIIWSKPNPMPESVTDRPTKAHEYIFLLTKSAKYFYDAEAIKERAEFAFPNAPDAITSPFGQGFTRRASATKAARPPGTKPQTGMTRQTRKQDGHGRRQAGFNERWDTVEAEGTAPLTRNKRSVWTIATIPFAEAHYATFPPELPEICIKAGTSQHGCCDKCGSPFVRNIEVSYGKSPKHGAGSVSGRREVSGQNNFDGALQPRLSKNVQTKGWSPTCECDATMPVVPCIVLDPFGGSGTTGMVADLLQRNAILIDLNPDNKPMAERRIASTRTEMLDLMEAVE